MAKKRTLFTTRKKTPFAIKLFKWLFSGLVTLLILGVSTSYFILQASLPVYDGEVSVNSLSRQVVVTRDDLGSVNIEAANREDLSYALGWTHAQERYFQMDLLRRSSAGELSELIGGATVDMDEEVRLHRFRSRAKNLLNQLPDAHLAILKSYTAGVNDGLRALDSKPFEYWILQATPELWSMEDSILVVYAMYLTLQEHSITRERLLQSAYQKLPEGLFDFLITQGTSFDAPIDFTSLNLPDIPKEQWNRMEQADRTSPSTEEFPGSNNLIIAGQRSRSGSAILAGDMHLGLKVPNIWFKTTLKYSQNNSPVALHGVTLPGTPLLIAGTNEKVAWTFTNSYGDYFDAIALHCHPDKPHLYRYQNEWHEFEYHTEMIKIKGAPDKRITIKETVLGPVELEENDTVWSQLWVAHTNKAINLNLIHMEHVSSVAEAIEVANKAAIPAQNILIGDIKGNIAWTIIGPLPSRSIDSNPFITIANKNGEIEWLPFDEYPKVINPEQGALWTANGRVLGNDDFIKIGNGGYANGARGQQIRDKLLTLEQAEETDLLNIQLDTEAKLHWRWRDQLLRVLKEANLKDHPKRREFRDIVANWNGRADAEQAGYTLVKFYRIKLRDKLLNPWAKMISPDEDIGFAQLSKQYEYPLWQITQLQPESFLPKGFNNYERVFLQAIDDTIADLTSEGKTLKEHVWGEHNRLAIKHPVSQGAPLLGWLLDMKSLPMPGDLNLPRVQTPRFGASQRMVISPGHLENAIFHMPGGQSGHPLSPFYEKGFNSWVNGDSQPLLAGTPQHKLVLKPHDKP